MAGRNDWRERHPRTGRRIHLQRFWLVIVGVLGGGVGLVVLSARIAPERHSDIWVELAKSGCPGRRPRTRHRRGRRDASRPRCPS